MNNDVHLKKLDEDDILEILLEHFQDGELNDCPCSRGCILGSPGKDLRFIGVFSKESESNEYKRDFEDIDNEIDFNGDHAFLKEHPEFLFQGIKSYNIIDITKNLNPLI